ncbi:hypothetical protein SeMB42_g00195 [Synchytrium endobioticum]|uniref:Uncharacterized protein n=1 Tax=Synchytrium endobioticum TaxID=286115 RepID=A0A507CN49_9FUNG|nr:hypothetical protein SeLEV6574_g06555 [Synchytrium endobioticum]TPX54619.1 hypothetical protein SeMB42_g00195 [Synchytrium endobioticum]
MAVYTILVLLLLSSALIAHAQTGYLQGRYDLIHPELIHPNHIPQYTRTGTPTAPIRRLKTPRRRTKRDTGTSILNISASFQLEFTCRNTNACDSAQTTFVRAAQRLAQVLSLPSTIVISATFESFCIANARDCDSSTLGVAAPASFHTWSDVAAGALGVDTGYSYPSALAKQLAPNDTTWGPAGAVGSTVVDIYARFNADFPWWFTSKSSTPPPATSRHAPYDFEQTVLHELTHGLGFISSWYPWLSNATLLPSPPVTDANGVYMGLAKPYIFNKWMVDSVALTWYYDYANRIMSDAAGEVATNDYGLWLRSFQGTDGYALAGSLMTNISTSNMRTLFMYPLVAMSQDYGYAVLYTPTNFSTGSSMSHLDAAFYDGSSEFLMRPFGTPYTALDDYSPMGALGPMGEVTLACLGALGYTTILDLVLASP